jgi:predicted HD phosphohydrolase
MDLISKIEALFLRRGGLCYTGERQEPVSALAHGLQCAQLAEWADADHHLVVAALLHDLGQLMDAAPGEALQDDQHELRALPLLATGFGPAVLEPIRLHVQAKRYLVSVDAGYAQDLTPASRHSLGLQGGLMSGEEKLLFMAQPFAREALQLRRWDDLAKHPGKRTPPLAYYLGMMQELLRTARTSPRLAIA